MDIALLIMCSFFQITGDPFPNRIMLFQIKTDLFQITFNLVQIAQANFNPFQIQTSQANLYHYESFGFVSFSKPVALDCQVSVTAVALI